jgi:Nucleotide modification associated domain 3
VKLIFSRKGFDSSAGGVPSPLVDDRPISLPIPTRMPTPTRFSDLSNEVAELVSDLTRGRIAADRPCNLDPDLDAKSLVRQPGWRGSLGQVSAAQSHLLNNDVGSSDVFLFWGLYRPAVRRQKGPWTFTGNAEHGLFGWLQINEVLTVGEDPSPTLTSYPWLESHPHLAPG